MLAHARLPLVAAILCSVSFSASAAQQDSVHSWGAWQGVQTAAGSGPQINPLRFGQLKAPNFVDATAFVTEVSDTRAAGDWKGYVAYQHVNNVDYGTGNLELQLRPAIGTVKGEIVLKNGDAFQYTENGRFIPAGEQSSFLFHGVANEGYVYRQFEVGNSGAYLETAPARVWIGQRVGGDEVTFGVVAGAYIKENYSAFIAGQPTVISQIQGLSAGNVIAHYSGFGYYSARGYANNTMTVNFGQSTWSGNWDGVVGVDASGVIQGDGFKSTTVSGKGVTAGAIEGTFFGENAKSLGGVLDVTKSETRIVGTFINEKVQLQAR